MFFWTAFCTFLGFETISMRYKELLSITELDRTPSIFYSGVDLTDITPLEVISRV